MLLGCLAANDTVMLHLSPQIFTIYFL